MFFDNEKLKNLSRYRILLLIIVASFVLRMFLRSNYLDDWDSVQFALAIKNYSIELQQPQPPGYPVYVFLGRIVDIFFSNPLQSLTSISALFGSLSIIPTYFLSEKFFDKRVGVLSAVLLSLTPAHLLFSEVAMTDIVSLFFITTTVYMLYLGIESRKCLYIGSILLGVTAGIRQTDALLIPLLLVVLLYRKKIKEWAISLSLTLGAACLWLIPVIWYTGFNTFIKP